MYGRRIKEELLTFAVSGKLWNDSLVMIDKETRSLWSHHLGEAKEGKMEDEVLQVYPSMLTDWQSWKERHPETSFVRMDRSTVDYRRDFYSRGRIKLSQFVVGLAVGSEARSWNMEKLLKVRLVQGELAGTPLVVFMDQRSFTALIHDRTLDGRTLSFEFDAKTQHVYDSETKSRWDLLSGKAVEGQLKGKRLKLLPGLVSFQRAWSLFHPDASTWND